MSQIDYSQLDQPHILMFVFHPREELTSPPPNANDHTINVDDGISIKCRFYTAHKNAPSILYFHGNGEVVYDYDGIAPLYNELGINLFVADYRGYGQSNGRPSFSNTVKDAHKILQYFLEVLALYGYSQQTYIMGRSLGSLPALELASSRSKDLNGLIIESGFASTTNLLTYLIPLFMSTNLQKMEEEKFAQIRSITLPTLIIHGQYDEIIPHEQAEILYKTIGSEKRKLVTIPNAGHNDMMLIGLETYFTAIRTFIFQNPR